MSVVLNIGKGTGALLLYTPAALDGREIEISRLAENSRRTHAIVRRRDVGSASVFAAVYPDLPAGDYAIWRDVRDRQHPRRRAARGRIEPRRDPPHLEQHFLGYLFGLRRVAQHAPDHPVHRPGQLVVHRLERALVAAGHQDQQRVEVPLPRTG